MPSATRRFTFFEVKKVSMSINGKQLCADQILIVDLGLSGDKVLRTATHVFIGRGGGTGQYRVELHTIRVERGIDWTVALDSFRAHASANDGFYVQKVGLC